MQGQGETLLDGALLCHGFAFLQKIDLRNLYAVDEIFRGKGEMIVTDSEPDMAMTVPEVSEYLQLAESTVYKLAKERKLPGRKVGGAWRFSRKGLEEWLARPAIESDLQNEGY